MHHDSVKALKNGYSDILKTLNYIHEEIEEKLDCKREANILFKKLIKLENAILTIIWEEVLERFDKVSRILQTPGLDVSEGYKLIFLLELFVKELRKNSQEKMNEFEKKAKNLSEEITGNYNDLNKRRKTHIFNGKDKFRVEVYNVLFDSLANELSKRGRVYKETNKKFLLNIGKKDHSHIDMESINYVISFYNNGVDAGIINECTQFREYLQITNKEKQTKCSSMLKLIYERNLIDVFPNLYTALKIFLTLPITSCGAERAFSKLTFIKIKISHHNAGSQT
ncbi:uncharacterized protein LOC136086109 [Hydra vulgaris]|uniref:Uncharacterized protein LOC136086109 n=1 Tax=Hydra vulgaris TaxID=6087 RepID=A0ABM4CRF7_HYDVU